MKLSHKFLMGLIFLKVFGLSGSNFGLSMSDLELVKEFKLSGSDLEPFGSSSEIEALYNVKREIMKLEVAGVAVIDELTKKAGRLQKLNDSLIDNRNKEGLRLQSLADEKAEKERNKIHCMQYYRNEDYLREAEKRRTAKQARIAKQDPIASKSGEPLEELNISFSGLKI